MTDANHYEINCNAARVYREVNEAALKAFLTTCGWTQVEGKKHLWIAPENNRFLKDYGTTSTSVALRVTLAQYGN